MNISDYIVLNPAPGIVDSPASSTRMGQLLEFLFRADDVLDGSVIIPATIPFVFGGTIIALTDVGRTSVSFNLPNLSPIMITAICGTQIDNLDAYYSIGNGVVIFDELAPGHEPIHFYVRAVPDNLLF